MLAGATSRRVVNGETLFLEGEFCRGMYLMQAGVIKIYKLSESGKEQILTLVEILDPRGLAELAGE